ncbi:NUDIX domain-containing protein [Microbacterium maritypicum]|uniref:NUDIX domain-containing protein n=1 Tax=Microbacterium maritypicum TaxID=33918 RepID=UPI0038157662
MPIDRSHIRVKAMLVAPNEQGTAHAVSVNAGTAENPGGYHRLIGGSVELGEAHVDAVRREVREELSATIQDLSYLGVVENIFRIDGEVGHEIVFVYTGRLDPEPAAEGATLTESDGAVVPVVWRSFDDDAEALPLYPAGVRGLFAQR